MSWSRAGPDLTLPQLLRRYWLALYGVIFFMSMPSAGFSESFTTE